VTYWRSKALGHEPIHCSSEMVPPSSAPRAAGNSALLLKEPTMASKNPFGKSRPSSNPYVSLNYRGWSWSILKLYKSPESSLKDPYARAFCNVVSPIVGPGGELGDVYLSEIPGARAWLAAEASKVPA
jgi:hypothetical protein